MPVPSMVSAASTDVVLVEVEHRRLPALSNDITVAVRQAEEHASRAVTAARQAGALLLEAKRLVRHGEWEQWVEKNTPLAARTAQAYMRLTSKLQALPTEEAQRVAELPLREAMKAISTAPDAPPRAEVYRPAMTDVNRARPVFQSASRSLHSITRDVGYRNISLDRIKSLRERLMATLEELDRMSGA